MIPVEHYQTLKFQPVVDPAALPPYLRYAAKNGWLIKLEFTDDLTGQSHFWQPWRVPVFSPNDEQTVIEEVTACRQACSQHLVRVIGVDVKRPGGAVKMEVIVHRPGSDSAGDHYESR